MTFFQTKHKFLSRINSNNLFILFSVVVIINLIFIIYFSSYLRPAADDYCFGKIASEHGLIQGIVQWWKTWSGDVYSITIMHILVGMPLSFFTESYISFLPFLLSFLGVGIITLIALYAYDKSLVQNKTLFVLYIVFFWWIFLWAGEFTGVYKHLTFLMARGLTHWQNLNGGLIAVELLFIAIMFTLSIIETKRSYYFILPAILLGFAIGTSGSVLSLTIFLTTFFYLSYLIYKKIKYHQLIGHIAFLLILFSTFIVIGVSVSHTSPGYIYRESLLAPNLNFDLPRMIEMIKYVIFNTFTKFSTMYFNVGTLVVLIIVVVMLKYVIKTNLSANSMTHVLRVSILTALFALLLTSVTVFSEFLTYEGYWHFALSYLFIFLSIVFFGIYISQKFIFNSIKISYLIVILFLFFASFVNAYAIKMIIERQINWSQGPAPLDGISDIEDPNGWQMECWNDLNKNRTLPFNRNSNKLLEMHKSF